LTTNDFDQAFGTAKRSTNFAQRLGKAEPLGESPITVGTGAYKPYGFMPSGTINETCEVVRWIEGTEIAEGVDFQYRFLLKVGFVGEEQLKLFLPDCIVVIDGKHLGDLRKKIARRQCTFIQQFSARVWPNLRPQGEPVIERIHFMEPKASEARR
jgi:hypothetical protein